MSRNKKKSSKRKTSKDVLARPWTEKEMAILFAAREDGMPYRVTALELKRTANACEHKYNNTNWSECDFYDEQKKSFQESMKKAHHQHMVKLNDNRIKSQKYKTDIIADKIAQSVTSLPKVKRPVYPSGRKSSKRKHSNEDVGLMFSDAHIGHHHTLEETGGLSEYNVDIFKERVEKLKSGVTDIVELHSHLYKIPTLHVFCLGDIVAGMNQSGNWSPIYINMPIYDQMIEGFEAISDMLYYWLGLFDNIVFYGVMGNHGRGAPVGFEKDYVNWDFLCYKFLQARFQDNPRVAFNVPKTWWILANIRNHKFLAVHGEDVKGGSFPAKKLQEYEQKMSGILGVIPDYTLAAHFHAAAELTTNHGRMLINGSFIGADVYALKNLQAGAMAEQKIFGIHDKRGITWSYNLGLSK